LSTPPAYAAHLPRFVLSLLCDQAPSRLSGRPAQRRAAVMFCDISGFTPLSETLGRHGKHGTEELTVQLNGYFETLLGVIEGWGGDTVKFGGDAVTVVFEAAEGEPLERPLRRAIACAREIFEVLGVVRAARTPWGEFPLSLKIGLSAGPVLTGLVGDGEVRSETVVAGGALDRMAEAEHHAKPGDIVLDCAAEGATGARAACVEVGDGFGRVVGLEGNVEAPGAYPVPSPPAERVRPFLLPAVWGQLTAGSEAMLGEHRRVATAFVAFPGLDYGAPESLPRLDEYFRRVHGLLQGFGGSFNRMDMGDKGSKFLCFFGAPESYEDNAERAVAFALALRGVERELPWTTGQRIGLSLGTNFCGMMGSAARREYTVMGDAVNTAARLMGASGPGEILAVQEVRQETQARYKWSAYRSLALKGKSAPIPVSSPLHPLRRQRTRSTQARVRMIGRSGEMALLRRARARAGRGPTPYFVLVGEAGIGKTTLLEQFLIESGTQGCKTAIGSAHAVGAAPLQSWSEVFWALLGGERGEREAIESRWKQLLPAESEFVGLGLRFLGFASALSPAAENLNPGERQEKTTALLALTLRTLAKESPVVVGLDGLNHADAGTRDLLAALLPRLRGARVLFLGASRPGAPLPGTPHEIALTGLGPEEVRALAATFLDAERVGDSLVSFAGERTGGNPLFVLELLQDLKERGAVGKDREGRLLFHPGQAGEIPGSVEGLLLARIDRLPLVTRNVLKVAACLGLSFDLGLLQTVFLPRMERGPLKEHLTGLCGLGLAPHSGPEPDTYVFAHATLRETAYGAVLLANRRAIHRSAAETLEARGDRADPSLLAFHFGQAEVWARALRYGLKAGYAASERFAFKEAAALFGEVEAWGRKAGVSISAADQARMADCFLQAGEAVRGRLLLEQLLSGPLSDDERLVALEAYLRLLDSQDAHAEVLPLAEELRQSAAAAARPDLAIRARRSMASSLFRLGRLEEALRQVEAARGEPGGAGEDVATLEILEAAIRLQRGESPEALALYRSVRQWAEPREHLSLQIRALIGEASCLARLRDLEASIASSRKAYGLAQRAGARHVLLGAAVTCSNALNTLERHQEAADLLTENMPLALQGGFPYAECAYFNEMGVTQYYQHQYGKAIKYYRMVGRIARQIQNTQQRAYSDYNIADAQRALGWADEAERSFVKALAQIRKTENGTWFVGAAREALAMAAELGPPDRAERIRRSVEKQLKQWKRPELLAEITA